MQSNILPDWLSFQALEIGHSVQVSMFVIISMDAKRTCCGLCMITMQHLSNYVRTRIPTVALVKGHALGGGCELAALCDTVIAHEDATFGLPEISLGVFPPVAAVNFPALIGYNATMRLMLTGETIPAKEALRLGLAHQVLSSRRFLSDAEELLTMLATSS